MVVVCLCIAVVLPAAEPSNNESAALKPFTLMLDWFVNPNHGPIILAQELGYFKEQGLAVTIQEPADPQLPPKLLSSGKIDLAVYYQPSLIQAAVRGLPLVWAGTLIATPLDGVIVLEESGIESLADLKGKSIGLSIGGMEHIKLDTLFKPYGFTTKDVKLINVGWNLSPSLMTKQVDAIMGGFRNFELNQLALEGKKGRIFPYESHGIPSYEELIFIANKDKYNKQDLRRFFNAIEKAVYYIANQPEQAWQIFKASNPKLLDNELNRLAWRDTVARFSLRPSARDQYQFQRFIDFLQSNGFLKVPLQAEALVVEPY